MLSEVLEQLNREGAELDEQAVGALLKAIPYYLWGNREEGILAIPQLLPRPRDIYDHTKIMAEKLCYHFALHMGLSTICLRVGRFFAQSPVLLATYQLYRGVDVRDAAAAHVLAVTNQQIHCDTFNITEFIAEYDTTLLSQH